MTKNTALYTRHIANKERIFPFVMSATGSCKTQVKPVSKNRFKVFVIIRSNWNYEILSFKGSYGKTGVPGVNPQWGGGGGQGREPGNNKLNLHKASTPGLEPWPAHALVEGECCRHFITLNFLGFARAAEARNQVCETENSWGFLSLGYPSEMINIVRDFADQEAPSPHIFLTTMHNNRLGGKAF